MDQEGATDVQPHKLKINRRTLLLGTSAATLSALAAFQKAHGLDAAALSSGHKLERDDEKFYRQKIHEGKGEIDLRLFCWSEGYPKPALLMTYTIPPGASEGVHTHKPGNKKLGSFDEFYYIVTGRGEMEIAGKKVPVTAGDHVFTPNTVPHGIENTSDSPLKVYLVAMTRA